MDRRDSLLTSRDRKGLRETSFRHLASQSLLDKRFARNRTFATISIRVSEVLQDFGLPLLELPLVDQALLAQVLQRTEAFFDRSRTLP